MDFQEVPLELNATIQRREVKAMTDSIAKLGDEVRVLSAKWGRTRQKKVCLFHLRACYQELEISGKNTQGV